MKSSARVATYQSRRSDPVWRLLAADNASVILGILQTLLYDEQRQLQSSIFHERVAKELEALRQEGWELPQTSAIYIAQWLAAGYLERTFPKDAVEEMYELTIDTTQAIRFVMSLTQQRRAATESRLALVIQQLAQLADETDTNPTTRVAQLEKERKRIAHEIQQIRQGKLHVLSNAKALERTQEIITLAEELANDFRQVRENFQQLNRDLREQVVDDTDSRGDILTKLFSGIDIISESESGRSFTAFWQLLTDPEQSSELEYATEQILSRSFMQALPRKERLFLSQLTRILLDQGGTVHDVLQYFARSLKQFVQSKMFREQRRMMLLLREAQQQGLRVKEQLRPTDIVLPELFLTSSRITSHAQYALYDVNLQLANPGIEIAESSLLSLATIGAWVVQSEINFRQLKTYLFELLQEHAKLSIADVLQFYPATQGLGTVVGYMVLGVRHGYITDDTQQVQWQNRLGHLCSAHIPLIYFLQEKRHEFSHRIN